MTIMKNQPRNLNNLFDEFFYGFPAHWGKDMQATHFQIPVNIHENKDAYHLELVAPGRNKEDFKIAIEKDVLTISFEQKQTEENKDYKTLRREFRFQSFKRSFTLDEKINADGIQAKYDNGVLKLLLPKKAEVTVAPKTIEII
ncbi:MAG: Hsp20/alpha crystallin family protein [Chitinophagaceae bacterium]|nr:Hsp20/alpha crystallin family protein [Chitinophagaceae bacterium]